MRREHNIHANIRLKNRLFDLQSVFGHKYLKRKDVAYASARKQVTS